MPASEKRNILIIVQNLPVPFDRRVWQEATSLRGDGFGVAVICPKKGSCRSSYEHLEGVDIYRYPLIYEAGQGILGYFVEFVYCWLATLWLAMKAYWKSPFHAIHACNPPDTFFALALLFRPLGVKFVFDHHDLCPEMYVAKGRPRAGILYRALLMLEQMTLKTAHSVIAVNQSHRTVALERGRIAPEKVTIVRSGPRSNWAGINTPRPELKRGRSYMVLYLGEMCEQDGVDYLLRAVEVYRSIAGDDTLFAFVGGGPDQPRIKTIAQEMGLGPVVYFTGRIPDSELWAYLSTTDVCVDPDPFSEWSNVSTMNKIIEYMAFGRPIVAFDLLEHRRSAESAAIYVEPNNHAAMAHAIRALLLDRERRKTMSEFARARFCEALAWENSEKQLIATYRHLLHPETRPEQTTAAPSVPVLSQPPLMSSTPGSERDV